MAFTASVAGNEARAARFKADAPHGHRVPRPAVAPAARLSDDRHRARRGSSTLASRASSRAVDHVRLGLAFDHGLVDHDLRDVAHATAARTWCRAARSRGWCAGRARRSCAAWRLARDRAQRLVAELELGAFHLEQPPVLLGERVLRLGQDRDQRRLVELLQRRDHRQAADELRDQAELDQVLGLDVVEQVAAVRARRSCRAPRR